MEIPFGEVCVSYFTDAHSGTSRWRRPEEEVVKDAGEIKDETYLRTKHKYIESLEHSLDLTCGGYNFHHVFRNGNAN